MSLDFTSIGYCLRAEHFDTLLTNKPKLPWIEVLADNFIYSKGIIYDKLIAISKHYPIILHCVGFGIGNAGKIDESYCQKVKALADKLGAIALSDHLCFTAVGANHSHGLLPLPMTKAVANHCAGRILAIEKLTGYPLWIENIASYCRTPEDKLTEADFINHVARQSNCGLLIDINNLYINAHNHDFNAQRFLETIDKTHVRQYHLGGHQKSQDLLVDTHDCAVSEPVWRLYQQALALIGPRPTCIEWDSQVPSLEKMKALSQKAEDCIFALGEKQTC